VRESREQREQNTARGRETEQQKKKEQGAGRKLEERSLLCKGKVSAKPGKFFLLPAL
jgi:hypothetical protein